MGSPNLKISYVYKNEVNNSRSACTVDLVQGLFRRAKLAFEASARKLLRSDRVPAQLLFRVKYK